MKHKIAMIFSIVIMLIASVLALHNKLEYSFVLLCIACNILVLYIELYLMPIIKALQNSDNK